MRSTLASDVAPVVRLFKALGDETRLRIVALLSHGELCVCHFQEALALPQTNVSRQLGVLRAAGVVGTRRSGSWVHYRLAKQNDPRCSRQLKLLVRSFSRGHISREDLARLLKARGPDSCP
ncbi:MAG: metalloregulator ArsR/SmtB family transcription factor [Acidobacteria bacterium]|nr:metalloregulator ArsR/SmtB family transcription factor [Acidobacteriota bacterium]